MSLLGGGNGGGGAGAVGGLAAANPYAALIAAAAKLVTNREEMRWKAVDRYFNGDPQHQANIDRINLAHSDNVARRWGAPTNYSGMLTMTESGPAHSKKAAGGGELAALLQGLGALQAAQGNGSGSGGVSAPKSSGPSYDPFGNLIGSENSDDYDPWGRKR